MRTYGGAWIPSMVIWSISRRSTTWIVEISIIFCWTSCHKCYTVQVMGSHLVLALLDFGWCMRNFLKCLYNWRAYNLIFNLTLNTYEKQKLLFINLQNIFKVIKLFKSDISDSSKLKRKEFCHSFLRITKDVIQFQGRKIKAFYLR